MASSVGTMAPLLSLFVDEPHFADADLFVDPQVFVCQLTSR